MGFGKSFGIGILVLIGFNVAIYFLSMVLWGIDPVTAAIYGSIPAQFQSFLTGFQSSPIATIFNLLSGMATTLITLGTTVGSIFSVYILGPYAGAYIAMFIPIITIALYCVTAAIIGYLAHHPIKGFAAWFLVTAIGFTLGILITGITAPGSIMQGIIQNYPALIVNGLAYGVIAMGFGYKFEE